MNELENIKINEVEYVRKDLIKYELPKGGFSPFEIGEQYFIQTVTNYYLGQLVYVGEKELSIIKASWVASTGRFNEFISGSDPLENEPYKIDQLVIIGRGALISAVKREVYLEISG